MRAFALAVLSVVALASLTTPASAAVDCSRGELCLWSDTSFRGTMIRLTLADTNLAECVPIGVMAHSFINRLNRPVSVYQSLECATEGEFDTYPGGGTYVPSAPFVVRGVQIWSH
ncbi:peptidase inhibitor family I36 protein [Actinokineospora sp. NPDC004072]